MDPSVRVKPLIALVNKISTEIYFDTKFCFYTYIAHGKLVTLRQRKTLLKKLATRPLNSETRNYTGPNTQNTFWGFISNFVSSMLSELGLSRLERWLWACCVVRSVTVSSFGQPVTLIGDFNRILYQFDVFFGLLLLHKGYWPMERAE